MFLIELLCFKSRVWNVNKTVNKKVPKDQENQQFTFILTAVRGRGAKHMERRTDTDGCDYTKEEFRSCYGNDDKWEALEKRIDPRDGEAKVKRGFIEHYGGLSEWNAASPPKPEVEEKRIDPADGNLYTKVQFISCYGGEREWTKAAEEHRIDEADSKAYTKNDFVVCYGDAVKWDAARPVGQKHEDPQPVTTSTSTPESIPVSALVKKSNQEQEPVPLESPKPAVSKVLSLSKKPDLREGIPSRKKERAVSYEDFSVLTSKQARSPKQSPRASPSASPRPRVSIVAPEGSGSAPQSPTQRGQSHFQKPAAGIPLVTSTPEVNQEMLKGEKLTLDDEKHSFSIVIVGHVDAGKSTMMGRLLFELNVVSQALIHKYERNAKNAGKQSFHFAWVLDETEEERERGVTMDVAVATFSTPKKWITVLDAPGHQAFVGRTCNGASQADAAVVVINAIAGEFETGLERGQTREHILILRGAGIRHLMIAVNKLDTVTDSEKRFGEIVALLSDFLLSVGFKSENIRWVPVSGLQGHNLVERKEGIFPWWTGDTFVSAVDSLPQPQRLPKLPLRMSISDSLKSVVGGKIETGIVSVGDKITVMPVNQVATIKSLQRHNMHASSASSGDYVLCTLSGLDEKNTNIAIGDAMCPPSCKVKVCRVFEAQIMVITDTLITKAFRFTLHHQSTTVDASVTKMLPFNGKTSKCLGNNKTGLVQITTCRPICIEMVSEFKGFGRIVMRQAQTTVAMGAVMGIHPQPVKDIS